MLDEKQHVVSIVLNDTIYANPQIIHRNIQIAPFSFVGQT